MLTGIEDLFPPKCSTVLNKWQQITWEDYRTEPCTQDMIKLQQVVPEDLLYRAHLVRASGTLLNRVILPAFPPAAQKENSRARVFWFFLFVFLVRLVAYIAVKCDYPVSPPIFSLQFHCSDERIAADKEALRVRQREVFYSTIRKIILFQPRFQHTPRMWESKKSHVIKFHS